MQVTQHGACLGLGLAGLGTNDPELFEELKNVLYTDSAIAGEAAGLGLGLLAVGSATDKAGELLAYAHDTQHEKVGVMDGRGWCHLVPHPLLPHAHQRTSWSETLPDCTWQLQVH